MKTCPRCKLTKELSAFGVRNRDGKVQTQSWCKTCKVASRIPKVMKPVERKCSKCQITKPIDEFYTHTTRGFQNQCKECRKESRREYYRRVPETADRFHMVRRNRLVAKMTEEDILITLEYRKALRKDSCFYCGQRTDNMHTDHFFPLAKGGTDHWHNLVRACGPCNGTKKTQCGTRFILQRFALSIKLVRPGANSL